MRSSGPARASTTKTELVRSIGADRVIDYTREDFADGRNR
jgi:NADPH:quinone reductase-like Zn-dependent oxidoreductase